MTYQVLVSTMNQNNSHKFEEMNLSSDAIIVNQGENDSVVSIKKGNYQLKFYSFNERGVGLSRNHCNDESACGYYSIR